MWEITVIFDDKKKVYSYHNRADMRKALNKILGIFEKNFLVVGGKIKDPHQGTIRMLWDIKDGRRSARVIWVKYFGKP